jgi:hypothetical protein
MVLVVNPPLARTVRPLDGGTVLAMDITIQKPLARTVRPLDGGPVLPVDFSVQIPPASAEFIHSHFHIHAVLS